MELFEKLHTAHAPLAERLRPQDWDEIQGQEKLTLKNGTLRQLVEKNQIPNLIFWGPPGSGKTTLARIIASKTSSHFVSLSAVNSGKSDLTAIVEEARNRQLNHQRTILFLDEIHRWNKAQQDAILPHTENGTLILIGATTENPSFYVNSALLSRSEVLVLSPLSAEALKKILTRALKQTELKLTPKAQEFLIQTSNSDARTLLNRLEILSNSHPAKKLSEKDLSQILNQKLLRYDKSDEEHYNLISALHKSLRGSDPDASLYYLSRMLTAGEPPLYIIRRLVRFASEDIGNADPSALAVALRAKDAYDFLGSPEGELAIAQTVVYLACSPKSNSIYTAFGQSQRDARELGNLEIPLHIRNAPTKLMKDLDYGKDYKYAHDFKDGFVANETYLPKELKGKKYYHPTDRGLEAQIQARLKKWRENSK